VKRPEHRQVGELVEGPPAKRFRIYRLDIDDNLYECVAAFDTIDEVRAFRRRPDWRYTVLVNRKRHTQAEFEAWVKTQPA